MPAVARASEAELQERLRTIEFPRKCEFLFRPARYKIIRGGRGSTKSWSVARYLIVRACKYDRRILCARELQNSIAESVHHLLEEQIHEMGLDPWFEVQEKTIYRSKYPDKPDDRGSEFIFYGIKTNTTKVKSAEGITECWVEEGEKVSDRSWEILIPTIRETGSEIFVTFNPDEETDPTYKRFVLNQPPSCVSVEMNWQDNPWFPEELRKEKDYLAKVDPEAYAHVWGGQCRRNSSAQIFKGKYRIEAFEVPRPDMCSPDNPMWDGPYYGADWGFSQDPCVLIKFWLAENPKRIYIERESWGIGVELDDIAPKWLREVPGCQNGLIRADSSRPETISHIANKGLRIEAAEKWHGSVEDGVTWMRSFQEIIVSPDCPHAAQEFLHYSFKKDRLTGDVLAEIVDKDNHVMDGIRYGAQPMIMASTAAGVWSRL